MFGVHSFAERLLDAHELGEFLGLSNKAIHARLRRNPSQLPPYIRIGASYRWRPQDVERWVQERLVAEREVIA